ncbi:MAG: ABC transporter permease subunit [Psychrobacillus psychrotolerans]
MIKFEHVSKVYSDGFKAVDSVNFEVPEGEFLVLLGGAGIMQTIPSLALLGFMIPIFGIGVNTAIAALFLYSLLPIIRNTYTGIKDVNKATVEAAKGMGMTSLQVLIKVELPLAIPMIMAGYVLLLL